VRKSLKRKSLSRVASDEWRVTSDERRIPEWELLVHTPAVFVRVANKGVAGYGTWKKIRKMEDEGEWWRERVGELSAVTLSAQRGKYRSGIAKVRSIIHDPW
jgi:hypothetical protein